MPRAPRPEPTEDAADSGRSADAVPTIRGGVGELRRRLSERTDDVRGLDPDGFRRWMARQVERWVRDPVFVQRCAIRDVRRINPEIRRLERELRRARLADEASPQHAELARLEKAAADATKAIDGLTAAAERATGDERRRLLRKRAAFADRQTGQRAELDRLAAGSPARVARDGIAARLNGLRAETGLAAMDSRLAQIQRERGRGGSRRGARFEDVAAAAVRACVLPWLAESDEVGTAEDGGALRILRGVTLGAAGTEMDQLVVRTFVAVEAPVAVLAVVEAKRDINDIGHGFRQRQQNLAWLTGDDAAYDAAAFRTRTFPSGHFDRDAVHEQGGERFRLSRESFRRFARDADSGLFTDRLWFVTRAGTLWGAGRAALSRLAYRAATDEAWDLDDDGYVDGLRRWLAAQVDAVEAPDVLRRYAASERRARQVLLVQE
jgi:hypothetical protein